MTAGTGMDDDAQTEEEVGTVIGCPDHVSRLAPEVVNELEV